MAQSDPNLKLSIIIPAYNEENRITATLEDYIRIFNGTSTELWVIVNNTTDRTFDIVEKLSFVHPWILPVNIPRKIGKGGAILEGFRRARGEIVGFVDADHSTSAEEFQRLVKLMGDADGVIASRWMNGAKISVQQGLLRRLASRVFNFLVRMLFGLPYHDTQCGAKLFRRNLAKSFVASVSTNGWAFDVDMLVQAKRAGCKIKEIPSVWEDKGDSTLNIRRAAPKMFWAIIMLRFYSWFPFLKKNRTISNL